MTKFINKVLCFLNRISCYIDLVLWYFICDYISSTQFAGNPLGFLVYIPFVYQIIVIFKTEYKIFKSNVNIDFILDNGRVMAFSGAQGRGKSSICCYLASRKRFEKVYSNTPLLLRQKFTRILDNGILSLDERIDDYSLLVMEKYCSLIHN